MENYFHAFHTGESGQGSLFLSVWSGRFWFHLKNVHHIVIIPGLFLYFTLIGLLAGSCLSSACWKSLVCLLRFRHVLAALACLCTSPANFVSVAASLHWFSFSQVACEKPEKKGSESLKTLLWHRTQTEPWSSLICTKTTSFGWDQGLAVWFWPGPEALHKSF